MQFIEMGGASSSARPARSATSIPWILIIPLLAVVGYVGYRISKGKSVIPDFCAEYNLFCPSNGGGGGNTDPVNKGDCNTSSCDLGSTDPVNNDPIVTPSLGCPTLDSSGCFTRNNVRVCGDYARNTVSACNQGAIIVPWAPTIFWKPGDAAPLVSASEQANALALLNHNWHSVFG